MKDLLVHLLNLKIFGAEIKSLLPSFMTFAFGITSGMILDLATKLIPILASLVGIAGVIYQIRLSRRKEQREVELYQKHISGEYELIKRGEKLSDNLITDDKETV